MMCQRQRFCSDAYRRSTSSGIGVPLRPEYALRCISVDEFSYRKRHHYLTVVVDHDTRRVVWAGKGRSAETLSAFFDLLGPSGCERIALVTVDLAASWQKALRARVPHARVVFDRFHVERLASDAVDEVRRAEQRRVGAKAAKALKGTRFCLLKHPARLKPGEKRRLETLRRQNRALDRAYQLKEYLAWAARSRLGPFVRLARTVGKHAAGILAYLDTRMTNGPVEGINNKLRVIARRPYGFHPHGALIWLSSNGCGWVEARSAGRRGVLAARVASELTAHGVHLTGGGRGAPWPGVGRSGVAAGRPACQRATRVLRCATALRVTHRPSLRSSSRYGPCGPAWTGASRPSTTTRKARRLAVRG